MPIPVFRIVEYTDDGCELYECLNCSTRFEIRISPIWKFCPSCGVEFTDHLMDYREKKYRDDCPRTGRLEVCRFDIQELRPDIDHVSETCEKKWFLCDKSLGAKQAGSRLKMLRKQHEDYCEEMKDMKSLIADREYRIVKSRHDHEYQYSYEDYQPVAV